LEIFKIIISIIIIIVLIIIAIIIIPKILEMEKMDGYVLSVKTLIMKVNKN